MIQLRRDRSPGANPAVLSAPTGDPVSGAALQWLQREATARFLVGRDLRIIWANNAAASMLESGEGVRSRGGVLTTGDRAGDLELSGLIGHATATPSARTVPGRSGGEDAVVLHIRKVNEVEPATYGISVYRAGDGYRAAYAPLDRIFDLTPVEHRTLLDLLDGHDAIAAARLRDVSVETVRSHIRSIYLKLDVRTREGLFHKLRAYQLPT